MRSKNTKNKGKRRFSTRRNEYGKKFHHERKQLLSEFYRRPLK